MTELGDHTITPSPLEALYRHRDKDVTIDRAVLAVRRDGEPLVLGREQLIPAREVTQAVGDQFEFVRVREADCPPMSGPFTPPPTPVHAVFSDERGKQPVLFVDVHGRAVCLNEEGFCYLAIDDEEFLRVEVETD